MLLLNRIEALSSRIGNTPVIPLAEENIRLYAKLEFHNLTGSVKDRPAFHILKTAVAQGQVKENTTVVESSSGNFAISLATICKVLGIQCIPVIDPHINAANELLLQTLCKKVVRITVPDSTGSYLLTRLKKVQELCKKMPNAFWPNQYENERNAEAHYLGTGAEICSAFKTLDYVFIGVSTGGTLAGVSKRVKEKFPEAKIIAVDIKGSVALGGKPGKRHIPGLGSSRTNLPFPRRAAIDAVMHIAEADAIAGCHALLEKHALFAGGSSGTVYAAIRQYFSRRALKHAPTVLFLCPDKGTSYLHTVYNPQWVARHIRTSRPVPTPSRKKYHALFQ